MILLSNYLHQLHKKKLNLYFYLYNFLKKLKILLEFLLIFTLISILFIKISIDIFFIYLIYL